MTLNEYIGTPAYVKASRASQIAYEATIAAGAANLPADDPALRAIINGAVTAYAQLPERETGQ